MDTEPGKPPRRNHILESDYDSDSTPVYVNRMRNFSHF